MQTENKRLDSRKKRVRKGVNNEERGINNAAAARVE